MSLECMEEDLMQVVEAGSKAQLRGDLTRDFTADRKEEIMELLKDAAEGEELLDRVGRFLVSFDPEVVEQALQVPAPCEYIDLKQSLELSYGWPGVEGPLDLNSCIRGCVTPEAARRASSVNFEFYDQQDGKRRVIRVGAEELQALQGQDECLALFNRLVREFRVPPDEHVRFALLNRIRFARAFPSTETRLQYVKIMIRAMNLYQHGHHVGIDLQLREVAIDREVREDVRIAVLACYGEGVELFSTGVRNAMVRSHLRGEQGCCSAEFVKALLALRWSKPLDLESEEDDGDGDDKVEARRKQQRSKLPLTSGMFDLLSLGEVVDWLEDEVGETGDIVCDELFRKQWIIRQLLLAKSVFDTANREAPLELDESLGKILDNSHLLERTSDSNTGVISLSSEGWKIVSVCIGYYSITMQADTRSKLVNLIIGGIPGVPESTLQVAMQNQRGLLAIALLQGGGHKFLEQLSMSMIPKLLGVKDPVDDATFESLGGLLRESLERGLASEDQDQCQKIAKVMRWMMRKSWSELHTGLVKKMITDGTIAKLFEALRRWCPSSSASSLLDYFRFLKTFAKRGAQWEQVVEQAEARRLKCGILEAIVYVLRNWQREGNGSGGDLLLVKKACKAMDALSPPTVLVDLGYWDFEIIKRRMEAARVKYGLQIPPPPLLEMVDIMLKTADLKFRTDDEYCTFALSCWRRAESGDHEALLPVLLCHIDQVDDAAAAAQAARVLSHLIVEGECVRLVRETAVLNKLLDRMFTPGCGELTKAFIPLMPCLFIRDSNPFAWTPSEEKEAVALDWLVSYIRKVEDPSRAEGKALLRIGEILTENYKLALKLVSAGDLTSLFQHVMRLYVDDPLWESRINMVQNLLEDYEMVYNRMVQKIYKFFATTPGSPAREAKEFVKKLSTSEPRELLQAAFDTCQVYRNQQQQYMIELRSECRGKSGETAIATTPHFRHVFAALLQVKDLDWDLLRNICESTPSAVDVLLELEPGVLDRALEGNHERFLGMVAKQTKQKKDLVMETLGRGFSCLDAGKLSQIVYWRVCNRLLDASVADCIVKRLCGLDLDHRDAGEMVSSLISILSNISSQLGKSSTEKDADVAEDEEKVYPISDECVEAFCARQHLVVKDAGEEGTSVIETAAEQARAEDTEKMELDESMNDDDASMEDGDDADAMEHETLDEKKDLGEAQKMDKGGSGSQAAQVWMIANGDLEQLVKLLWIAPNRHRDPDGSHLATLFEKHTDHGHLTRALVGMLLNPGALRVFPPVQYGLSYQNPVSGVCRFVVNRVADILHRFADSQGFSLRSFTTEDDAVSFMILMLKHAVSLEKVFKIMQGTTISEHNVVKLCNICAVNESVGDVLASLIAVTPLLYPGTISTMAYILEHHIQFTMERLASGDHSTDVDLLRLVQAFAKVVVSEDIAMRDHPKLALDSLWVHASNNLQSRQLIRALYLAQTISSSGPTDSAVKFARVIKGRHHLNLLLPVLQKWPNSFTLDLETKLMLLVSVVFGHGKAEDTLKVIVGRDSILQDSYEAWRKQPRLVLQEHELHVFFKGELETDGDLGPKAEWFQILSRALAAKLFSEVGDCYQPNPCCADQVSYFKFAGQFVAKAILEEETLDIRFAPSFLKHILGREVSYTDMEPELLKNLTWLLQNKVDESMGFTFSVDNASSREVVDLVPGGRNINVTEENKHRYVNLLTKYRLTDSIKPQLDAFLAGFYELVPKDVIGIFKEEELELLISGSPDIDVAELKRMARSFEQCDILTWFWDIVENFDKDDRTRLLKFVTGSSKTKQPRLEITISGELGENSLPTARTCIGRIYIPRSYRTREQLEQKLVLAIREGCEGFTLKE